MCGGSSHPPESKAAVTPSPAAIGTAPRRTPTVAGLAGPDRRPRPLSQVRHAATPHNSTTPKATPATPTPALTELCGRSGMLRPVRRTCTDPAGDNAHTERTAGYVA